MDVRTVFLLGCISISAACAYGANPSETLSCGRGTVKEDGICVPDDSTGGNGGSGTDAASSSSSSTSSSSSSSSGAASSSSSSASSTSSSGGIECIHGVTRTCYSGPPGSEGIGECNSGVQTCSDGTWLPCIGDSVPSSEKCDGLDNDCNGSIDDGFGNVACGLGACANTVAACVNGVAMTCMPKSASPEACNGIDDDCDGVIDDATLDSEQSCNTGSAGECANGKTKCLNGVISCVSIKSASPEQCNGLDDDCNGVADDGNPGAGLMCSTGKLGVCGQGTASCVSGAIVCNQTMQSSPDICDGKDNDCNGVVDDGCPPTNQATFQTEPGYFDAVLDTERHQVFLSYGGSGYVRAVGLGAGSDTVILTGHQAQDLFFEPIQDRVVVSLKTNSMNSSYFAAINAISLANPALVAISSSSGDIIADGTGKAFLAASGYDSYIVSIDIQAATFSTAATYQRINRRFAIHPMLNRAYMVSPNDDYLERWNIVSGAMTPAYTKTTGWTSKEVRIHPSGNTLYTQSGNLYLASNVQATDMTNVGTLGVQWMDLTFHPSGNYIYLLTDGNAILTYDPNTLSLSSTHPLTKPAQRIFAGPSYLVVLTNTLGGNPKTQIDVIPYANL